MKKLPIIRKFVVYILYVLFFCCFQVSFPEILSLNGQIADLMFVFTVLVAYMFGFYDGMVVAFFVGIIRDYFAGPSVTGLDGKASPALGIGLLVMVLAAAVGSSFFTRRMHRNTAFAFLAIMATTAIYKVVGYIVIKTWALFVPSATYSVTVGRMIVRSLAPQLLLNLIVTVPIYLLLRFVGPYKKGINPKLIDEHSEGGNTWLTL